ncbi:MAG: amidohydrolase family protein [Ignavibacteria bacterium]|nr:amidohydrolase family protein [Ignavibacteria bacterium]
MNIFNRIFTLLLVLVCSFPLLIANDETPGAAQQKPIALTNAKLYTITQGIIQNGTIVFDKGKITAVGQNIQIPADAQIINCDGKFVYPGFIAPVSTIGLVEIEAVRSTRDVSESGIYNPNAKAEVAYNPDSEIIPTVRSNGVLLANVVPDGGVISGRASLMMLDGWTREDIALKPVTGLAVQFPRFSVFTAPYIRQSADEQRKENSKRLQDLTDYFEQARMYSEAAKNGLTDNQKDIRLEAMRAVFEENLPVLFDASEEKQIRAVIQFAQKFNLKAIIVGGTDALQCSDVLREANIPVILQKVHSVPRRDEQGYDTPYTLPAQLAAAGVKFALSDGGSWQQRNLPFEAGTAMAFGLSENDALRALTLTPAEILGVAGTVGSLDVGKDATLFVSKGNALDGLTNSLEFAYIQGRSVSLSSKQTKLAKKYRTRYEQK